VNEDGFDGSLDTKALKARCWPMHATKVTWKVCPLSIIIGFIIEKQILELRWLPENPEFRAMIISATIIRNEPTMTIFAKKCLIGSSALFMGSRVHNIARMHEKNAPTMTLKLKILRSLTNFLVTKTSMMNRMGTGR
jgi:hypothetical protein